MNTELTSRDRSDKLTHPFASCVLILGAVVCLAGCSHRPIEDGAQFNQVTQVRDLFTSFFVLETSSRVVLFDAGFRPGRLESRLDELGPGLSGVTDVFITHGHGDHVAGLSRLDNAQVFALADGIDQVEEESGKTVDVSLSDRQEVVIDDVTIEVFSVPGHTSGNAIYLVNGVLLLGDSAFATRDGDLIPTPPEFSDDPAALETRMRQIAEELAPRAEEIEWLAPSHTGGLEGSEALLTF